jgi:hypothetical protein
MQAEDSRQADTGEEESGRNSEGALHGAEADVTTRPRTKAEWEQENGLMDAVCERGNVMLAYQRVVKLKLTVNEEKTHVCRLPQERFDFLGYTFGRCYSPRTGRAYLGSRPATKSIKRLVSSISQETDRRRTWLEADVVVGRLNRQLTGWANYFCLGPVSPAYRAINAHVTRRLRRWLCQKHKVRGSGWARYPDQYLHNQLGLIHLPSRTRDLPWAKA